MLPSASAPSSKYVAIVHANGDDTVFTVLLFLVPLTQPSSCHANSAPGPKRLVKHVVLQHLCSCRLFWPS
eukprot:2394199-Amphidinium_carterae.1